MQLASRTTAPPAVQALASPVILPNFPSEPLPPVSVMQTPPLSSLPPASVIKPAPASVIKTASVSIMQSAPASVMQSGPVSVMQSAPVLPTTPVPVSQASVQMIQVRAILVFIYFSLHSFCSFEYSGDPKNGRASMALH